MSSSAVALSLLVLAALLAGLGGAVRALKQSDGNPRSALLATAVGSGVVASGLSLAPVAFGPRDFSPDLSSLGILALAAAVATADLVEVTLGMARLVRAWPARASLQLAEDALDAAQPGRAAEAYRLAIGPLVEGAELEREMTARLGLAAGLAAAGDRDTAALRLGDALERARGMDSPRLSWSSLLQAAAIETDLDRLAEARVHLGEAATIARDDLTDAHLATVFAELGWTAYLDGDRDLAGTCLAWAAHAAGSIDAGGEFAATTTLLAAYLALAGGDLAAAGSALDAVEAAPSASEVPDLAAGLLVGRCCLGYLQGWQDSARSSIQSSAASLNRARHRSRIVIPLVALTLHARATERREDARALGAIARRLAPPGGTLAGFAAYCANAAADPTNSPRAVRVGQLLAKQAEAQA